MSQSRAAIPSTIQPTITVGLDASELATDTNGDESQSQTAFLLHSRYDLLVWFEILELTPQGEYVLFFSVLFVRLHLLYILLLLLLYLTYIIQ